MDFFKKFFNFFLIKLIIQFDYYFIKNIQFVILSTILYKLIFNIFFQVFFKYIYQSDIILFDIVSLSLKFYNIFCCKFRLLYFLNLLFRNPVFVGDTEDSVNFFLEKFLNLKKYFYIDVTEVF